MNKIKELKFKSEPYLIKNDKFSTIEFRIFFEAKYDKKYIFYLPLLRQILLNTSKNYPSEIEYRNAYKENMIISMNMKSIILNENLFFQFSLIVPDPKKVKNYVLLISSFAFYFYGEPKYVILMALSIIFSYIFIN